MKRLLADQPCQLRARRPSKHKNQMFYFQKLVQPVNWNLRQRACLTKHRAVADLLKNTKSFLPLRCHHASTALPPPPWKLRLKKDNLHRESFHAAPTNSPGSNSSNSPGSPKTVSGIPLVGSIPGKWHSSSRARTKSFRASALKWHPWKRPSPSRPFE